MWLEYVIRPAREKRQGLRLADMEYYATLRVRLDSSWFAEELGFVLNLEHPRTLSQDGIVK